MQRERERIRTFWEPRIEETAGEAAARSGLGANLDEGDLESDGRYAPRSRGEVSERSGRRDCEKLLRRVRFRALDRITRRVAMIDPHTEGGRERESAPSVLGTERELLGKILNAPHCSGEHHIFYIKVIGNIWENGAHQ